MSNIEVDDTLRDTIIQIGRDIKGMFNFVKNNQSSNANNNERDKFQLQITNNEFSVSDNWNYYAYVLDFHNGLGIFHLRVYNRNDFRGQSRLGEFPDECIPLDLFEICDQNGLVNIWTSGKYITINSENTLPANTRLDFHNVISLNI